MIRLTRLRYLFPNIFKIKPDINQRIARKYVAPITFYRSHSILGHDYKPHALLRTFKSTADNLTIHFQDGLLADFSCIWLRDSCRCEDCIYSDSKERKLDAVSLNLSIYPTQYHITNDGRLKIVWPDNEGEHTSYFEPSWLHRYALGFHHNVYEEVHDFLPPKKHWNAECLNENLPKIEYEALMQSPEEIQKFLVKFNELGMVIIENASCKAGEIMNKIAHVECTKWGCSYEIMPDDANNSSNTGLAQDFDCHTELNYLEKSPGVKVIHCLEKKTKDESKTRNDEEDSGKSYFVDGFYVAQWLKENYPLYFKTLCEVPVKFRFVSKNMYYVNYQPTVTFNRSREIREVHFNDRRRAPLEGPPSSIMNFYVAYQLFGENVRKSENQFRITLNPGDVIILNNRRVLHGNKGYDASEISTHLAMCYADMDDILARYRLICAPEDLNLIKENQH